jgi:WD40 repeat protein
VVRDIEFHGAPILDSIVFIDRDRVIARWSRKLFLIGIEENSVTPLPDVQDDPHIDSSGRVFALQQDGVVKLFNLPDFRLTTIFDKSPSNLLQIADGGRFLVFETPRAPANSFIDIWSTENKTRISRIAVPAERNHLAFNSSGRLLFTTEGENLQAWEIPSGRRRFSIVSDGDIDKVFADPSSTSFATIANGRLTVWDAVTGNRLAQFPGRDVAFSSDGRYLLTTDGQDATLSLWRSSDLRDEACARLSKNLSYEEWGRLFPNQPYNRTCPNLPAGINRIAASHILGPPDL